ncbi:MAG TPA: acyltransferase [Prevotella sp.]
MIESLQSLRVLMILLVFMSHFGYAGIPPFNAGGDGGVAFFFVLSGFVTALSQSNKIKEGTYRHKHFLTSRLKRLYPLHMACLAAVIVLHGHHYSSADVLPLAANALLVQSFVPLDTWYFSGNSVAWFLSTLLFSYLLFPCLYRLLVSSKPYKFGFCSAGMAIFYALCLWLMPASHINSVLYVSPLLRTVDFSIGLIGYRLYRQWQQSSAPPPTTFAFKSFLETAALVCFAVALVLYPDADAKLRTACLFWPGSLFLILVFAAHGQQGGIFCKMLTTNILCELSKLTFYIYMTHQILISICLYAIGKSSLSLPYIGALLLTILTTIFVAILIKKSHSILKTKFSVI